MGGALEIFDEDKILNKALAMDSFKAIYQKNRKEKKPGKLMFDELGYYHQFFEEAEEATVGRYSKPKKRNKSK